MVGWGKELTHGATLGRQLLPLPGFRQLPAWSRGRGVHVELPLGLLHLPMHRRALAHL